MTAYASWSVVFGEQPSAAKWNILGTNDAAFNAMIQPDGSAVKLLDSNGNEILRSVQTASAVNEFTITPAATGSAPIFGATGGDTNIDVKVSPKGTGRVKKGANNMDTYEELARLTLSPAGDTVTSASFTARKYLRLIFVGVATGGTVRALIRFNADTGNNYAWRRSENGGADTTGATQSAIQTNTAASQNVLLVADIVNILASEKLVDFTTVLDGATGVGNAPNRSSGTGKWVNTSAQITAVTILNDGSGDFSASGSELLVLGHD